MRATAAAAAAIRGRSAGLTASRRRLLDNFLVPALDRALAFDKRDDGAKAIAEELDFDVARADEASFEVHARIAEGRPGLGPRRANRREQVLGLLDDAHALPAAAGNGLDDEGISDGAGRARDLVVTRRGIEWLLGSRHDRHAGADGHGSCAGLAAHRRDRFWGRTNERQAGVAAGTREGGVLGQEPIAWMYRLGAGSARDVENCLDVEVAAGRLVRAEVEGLMRLAHVPRGAVAVGIDRHGRQPQFAAGANDPNGDLAAVGDEDFH